MNWYLGSYGKSIKGSLGKVKIIMAESCQKKAQAPSEKPAKKQTVKYKLNNN